MSRIIMVSMSCILFAGMQCVVQAADSNEQIMKIQVIPQPLKIQQGDGVFTVSDKTVIFIKPSTAAMKRTGEYLSSLLAPATGLKLAVKTPWFSKSTGIVLRLDGSLKDLGDEGYTLTSTPGCITITAQKPAGVFYGVQTLRQLLPVQIEGKQKVDGVAWQVPCVSIEDKPRFKWRGVMLDCSRTFQSLDYLHKTIDRLAAFKMNVLHMHLTDDQGWRMEIKKHPELTQKGARFSAKYNEPESHQGFYTQDQLRELVKYAAERHVTIVPEIEMPGHSLEVLVCRPELSCSGKVVDDIFPFFKGPNITCFVLCAGNDDTFRLMEDVLDEVIDVFPSKFIHIGGDEAPKDFWKACAKCQARIKAEGLKNEHELQSYFIRRIEKHINSKNRRLIGWSEIMEGGLAPNAAVMDWIGGAGPATKAGHNVVMSPTSHCYFDYAYNTISTERAYSFEPCGNLPPDQAKYILGLQANFWSHIDREPELVDKQLFPRLLAISERGWSPAGVRDWPAFKARMEAELSRLGAMGIQYKKE